VTCPTRATTSCPFRRVPQSLVTKSVPKMQARRCGPAHSRHGGRTLAAVLTSYDITDMEKNESPWLPSSLAEVRRRWTLFRQCARKDSNP
jgi:hypothetical protein